MNDTPPTRPNYFTGEALLTADFICEQSYQMDSLARLNRSLHTYGIAAGLEVYWQVGDQANQVQVWPGMAIDGEGRQIVLTQPRVVTFSGIQQGVLYYLTICYHEAFDELTAESGVLGYKRVVQQPLIRYERTLQDPALNILLAVVDFSAQGQISALAYRAGTYERRYVGSVSGAINLVTEGSGIGSGGPDAGIFARQTIPSHVTLSSRKEPDGFGGDFLEVAAERAEFSGHLATSGNLGIGTLHPEANLEVEGIIFEGPGAVTTLGSLLTLSQPISPPLQPGDLVIPRVPVGAAPLVPAQIAIADITRSRLQYVISPALNADITSLTPYPYTYVRSTLARFRSPRGTLFSVGYDGAVGLGVTAPGGSGPNALTITPEGQVRIGLTGSTAQANLQVSGQILTDALVCNGALTARTFAGNGSKLTDLNFVSDWTRQNVSASNTALYYLPGNVGVRMSNPPGVLSVGTGPQRVGSGLITSDRDERDLLHGFQTLFTQELATGDSITVGELVPQMQRIARIISDTELELQSQFPLVVQESAYKTIPGDSKNPPGQGQPLFPGEDAGGTRPAAEPTPGPGKISTVGTRATGVGTSFTSLAVGDFLVIDEFVPNRDDVATWRVREIENDTKLTLIVPRLGATFPANASAYVIRTGLLAIFQGNTDSSSEPTGGPAMLIVDNGLTAGTTQAPNTVAINLLLESVDPTYALQVNGAVNFSGSTTVDHVTCKTLVAKTSIAVTGDGTADQLLAVGEGTSNPLLTVTKANLLVGNGNPSGALLDVGADIHAGGNVTAAATVHGANLTGNTLVVSGVSIDAQGNVGLMGPRSSFTEKHLDSKGSISRQAKTDGTVIAILGLWEEGAKSAGRMSAETSSDGSVTSVMHTHASSVEHESRWFSLFGQITLPVLKGESWQVNVFPVEDFPLPPLQIYWIPWGPQSAPVSLPDDPRPRRRPARRQEPKAKLRRTPSARIKATPDTA
jgi:trimeric autotransporter adhesin